MRIDDWQRSHAGPNGALLHVLVFKVSIRAPKSSNNTRHILRRRQSESARVFTRELGGTFVPHFQRRGGHALAVHGQQLPRLQQPQLFLVLQRAQGGYGFEVTMKDALIAATMPSTSKPRCVCSRRTP